MKITEYSPTDIDEIISLFYDCVHTVNAKDYTKPQLNAWADKNIDKAVWNKSLTEHYTLVAKENSIIIGFGDIDKTGYLDRLYVHKDYQNKCVATKICDMLEKKYKTDTITVHASITAKPFFEKRGYKVLKEQQVQRKGELLTNFIMEKN